VATSVKRPDNSKKPKRDAAAAAAAGDAAAAAGGAAKNFLKQTVTKFGTMVDWPQSAQIYGLHPDVTAAEDDRQAHPRRRGQGGALP
jgi:hypothetical protein